MKKLLLATLFLGCNATHATREALAINTFKKSNYINKCNISHDLYRDMHNLGVRPEVVNAFEKNSKVTCKVLKSKDVIIVDYTKSINDNRLFVVSYGDSSVKYTAMVSHAFNTGRGNYAKKFSNVPNSNYSSKGLFKIHDRVVRSISPYSFPVSGLENQNNNAYRRNITIHRSLFDDNDYVGHSEGCFAITPEAIKKMKEFNIGGSYLYAYYQS